MTVLARIEPVTDVIIPAKPRTPVTARHQDILGTFDIDGRLATPLDNEALIPLADCEAIIAEMSAAMVGSPEAAVKGSEDAVLVNFFVKKIAGAYPQARADNPDAYVESLTLAVAECPPDLLTTLYDRVTRDCAFVPTRAEVLKAVNALTAKRRLARHVAKRHIAEHERRGATSKPVTRFADLSKEEQEKHNAEIAKLMARPTAEPVAVPNVVGFKSAGACVLPAAVRERMAAEMAEQQAKLKAKAQAEATSTEVAE